MSNQQKRIQKCDTCSRATNDAYLCRRCAGELRDLLIGSREPDGQPGIVWYVHRLRESAYGQTRMARSLSARTSNTGYALLGNNRAAALVDQISRSLACWEAHVEALSALHGHENGFVPVGVADRRSERLEAKRARFIAGHVVLIRHHSRSAARLHTDMINFAREAWRIINRPNDICCGPCPNMVIVETELNRCGTLLYAEEGATGVECPLCKARHNVESLRDSLRDAVADMLFTGPELMNLMETRLNDRISKSTFYQLIRDGRLKPRETLDDAPMFTYDDVVQARGKPKPHKRIRQSDTPETSSVA